MSEPAPEIRHSVLMRAPRAARRVHSLTTKKRS